MMDTKIHTDVNVIDQGNGISVAAPDPQRKEQYDAYVKYIRELEAKMRGYDTNQEYPWLFPDQVWTVTGKANEDTDRATVKNLIGNGNDLVLSNFAFAGNSGYGSYVTDFTSWTNGSATGITYKSFSTSACNGDTSVFQHNRNGSIFKAKVTGITDQNCRLEFGSGTIAQSSNSVLTDGTYEFRDEGTTGVRGFKIYDLDDPTTTRTLDNIITIEQIPDYEGYLVTDGVDDKITSSAFTMGKDFTIVGEWEFIQKENVDAGVSKVRQTYLYNSTVGARVNINSVSTLTDTEVNKILGVTGDGNVYNENWEVVKVQPGDVLSSNSVMQIGHINDINFTKLAFKNLAVYPMILSKEDCIKAYNYLQTLKEK